MNRLRTVLALACAGVAATALAQSPAPSGSCLLAGRLSSDGGWAPRMPGVTLLGADGGVITGADRSALAGVRQVRLAEPALLSRCEGDRTLAEGGDATGGKAPVPAVGAGVLAVQAVHYPRLPRSNAQLVELQVEVPAERVTMVTR